MTMADWTTMTGAGLAGLAGLALLYQAWKKPGSPWLVGSGWALLAGSATIAGIANGDRGSAQTIVIAIAGATVFFAVPLLSGIAPPVAGRRRHAAREPAPVRRPVRASLAGIWTFLITGPVAGAIALFGSAALFRAIRPESGSPATAGVVSILAAVLIWAALSVALLIEPRPARRFAFAGLALAATAALALI